MLFSCTFLATMVVIFLFHPGFSAGWQWDLLQGLGYCAIAIWFYLIIDTGKAGSRAHQTLSIAAFGCACGHTLGLLLIDPTLWHYLTLDGAGYMLAGLFALSVMATSLLLALPTRRRRWHPNYRHFRTWHKVLTWAALLGLAWHILESGAYLNRWGFWVLTAACMVLIACNWLTTNRGTRGLSPDFHPRHLATIPIGLVLFVAARQF